MASPWSKKLPDEVFSELLQCIKNDGAWMKDLVVHVNYVAITDGLELSPSGTGLEIFQRNSSMPASN